MKKYRQLFTSESVAEGHPDKLCDRIADACLDACLAIDSQSRVACEVFATEEKIIIGGEITSTAHIDYEAIARNVLREVGYTDASLGIGAESCEIEVLVKEQSPDIAQGVNSSFDLGTMGAGDQGIMFGYASNESENLMPLPVVIAHKLVRIASDMRHAGQFKYARPDMKSQVTIDYTDSTPRIDTVVMSCQHDPEVKIEEFRKFIHDHIMVPVCESFGMNLDFKYLINPTGRFVIGGPLGDTGLTGRKIIVDTYGGKAPHGGGSFSGKDPTKVDRSATYMARYVAKNIVAAELAKECQIELSYAIGVTKPVSVSINTFGTATIDEDKILDIIDQLFDLTPGGIISQFSLQKPSFRYQDLSNYGHFGRPDLDLPWEKTDKVAAILKLVGC